MKIFDRKFKEHIWKYILQCLGATGFIVVVLLFLDVLTTTALIAALGASTFIVFTMPRSYPAYMRSLLGGYLIGIGSGVLCNYLNHISTISNLFQTPRLSMIIFSGLAVGIAIFIMSITNTEHAPASAVALGLVMNKWDIMTIIFILCAILLLTLIRVLLMPIMIDVRQLENEKKVDKYIDEFLKKEKS